MRKNKTPIEKPLMLKQTKPHTIKFELTEGCNLWCPFCGIHSIRQAPGNYKFMSLDTAKKFAERLKEAKWYPKLDCAMHGDPLINPNAVEIFKHFREQFPKMYILTITNGKAILEKDDPTAYIDELLEYVNFIGMDNYDYAKIVPKILKQYHGKYKISIYPEVETYTKKDYLSKGIVVYPDILRGNIAGRKMCNLAGAAGPPNFKYLHYRCQRPFKEMVIKHDGTYVMCCNDWRRYFRIGNIHDRALLDLWNDKFIKAARRTLLHEGRTFSICYGCDAFVYRPGLLPDHMGKYTLAKPSRVTRALLKYKESQGSDIEVFVKTWRKARKTGLKKYVKKAKK